MNMKKIYAVFISGLSVLAFSSCEGFLDKFPETSLSPETFYTSEKELELATNGFYTMLPSPDNTTDGALQDNDLEYHVALSSLQMGNRSAENETWSSSTWSNLRALNYYLEHSVNCTSEDIRKKYDGVAYFFRAMFYYEKVRKYGDIPWYDHVISANDKASLYRARDSRGFVMQKIMEDLDKAIDGLPVTWTEGVYRINKYAAYAFKSRVALFEGTWRKYHDVPDETYTKDDGTQLTLSSEYFLRQSADAAKAVIDYGKYKMYKGETIVKGQPYRDFFVLEDAETSETILSRRYLYTDEMNIRHGVQFKYKNQRHSLTRALAYHYLMADGTPFQSQEGWQTMQYNQEFKNRDPRMAQTIAAPDYVAVGTDASTKYYPSCKDYDRSGYRPIKYFSDDTHDGAGTSTTDYAIFRYGEVLLNYAEAKAELGEADQTVIDQTVNVIRARVGMPALDVTKANGTPDAFLSSYYTDKHLDGPDKGLILEIRRERTVELVNEGFRLWDMLRWHEGQQLCPASNTLGPGFIGCWFPGLGEYDMNNDGTPDLCIYTGTKPYTDCENTLDVSEGKENTLSEGTSGYLIQFKDQTYKWEEKDYLYPIPVKQIQIYPKDEATGESVLTQNPRY